jgi:hypothetical protein
LSTRRRLTPLAPSVRVDVECAVTVSHSTPSPAQTATRALIDPAIPSVRRLASPRRATKTLRAVWKHGLWPEALPVPDVRTVRILRYHAGSRCTLWLALDGWPSGGCIAKVYARGDAAAADVLRAMRQAGFAERSVDRVPALIAALPGLHMLLLDVAPGLPIKELLRDGAPDVAVRAARWLAAFHGARLPLPAAYTLRDPLAVARRWNVRLARATPELASAAARMFDALTAVQPPWPPQPHLIHGDLSAGHIFVAPEATTVIDWDRCRPGDPSEDAGRFLASLYGLVAHNRAGGVTAAAAAFQATYVAARPDAAASLSFYTALACLHKASRGDRHVHDMQRHHRRASTLLEAGLAALGAVYPT